MSSVSIIWSPLYSLFSLPVPSPRVITILLSIFMSLFFCLFICCFLFYIPQICENTWFSPSSVWLISLSIIPSSMLIQVAGFPCLSWLNILLCACILFIYPCIQRHRLFLCLAIVNNPALNGGVQTFLWGPAFISVGHTPASGAAGSCGGPVFN